MDSNFTDHLATAQKPGRAGFVEFLKMVSTAFPDIQVKIDDLFCTGNRVAARLTVTGTHTGALMGKIQPTGKKAVWTGIDIFNVENGKIKDRWSERNIMSLMRQIGVEP